MVKPKFTHKIANGIDKIFTPIARFGYKYGITANSISLIQIPFIALMLIGFILRSTKLAIIFLAITLFLDALDGAWARATNDITLRGHIYDKVMDKISIYSFLIGMGFLYKEQTLILILLALISTFLYLSNEFYKPELYIGIRSYGLVALIVNEFIYVEMYFVLLISAIVGIVMIIFKLKGAIEC